MKRLFYYILFSITLITVSCQGELFPLEEEQPLILEPTPDFKATELNPLCEINYFEENLSKLYDAKLSMENHPFYKAIEEWNKVQSNVKFKFQRDLAKCNMQIIANDLLDFPYKRDEKELGLFTFNTINKDVENGGLYQINKNFTAIYFSTDALLKNIDSPNTKRVLMYNIGRYLGLPDSKNRNSYMFPYLIKDGTQGKITDEDIEIFKKLHPNVCGNVSVAINSYLVNANGSVNFSVKYNTTSSVKSTVLGCGVVIGEDSIDLTLEKKSYYILKDSGANGDIFAGKINKLNSQTRYYAKAFSFDANGITYGDKITQFITPFRLHDKWERIDLTEEVYMTGGGIFFEYKGKLILGASTKNNGVQLNIYDPVTQKVSQKEVGSKLTFDSFYSNGYIYSLIFFSSVNGVTTDFYRLNMDNFVWEKLSSISTVFFGVITSPYGGYSSFSNNENLYFVSSDSRGFAETILKYNILKNQWTTTNISNSRQKYLAGPQSLKPCKPYYKDGVFYFVNAVSSFNITYNERENFFDEESKSKSELEFIFPQFETLYYYNRYLSKIYEYDFSGMTYFQGNFIKLLPPARTYVATRLNGIFTNDNYIFSSSINEALSLNLYNVDRQLLLAFNFQSNIFTDLTPPPQEYRKNFFFEELYPKSFILSDKENIYIGSSIDNNTYKYIWKYIP